MLDLLIKNAKTLDSSTGTEILCSAGVRSGRIVFASPADVYEESRRTIDAKGAWLFPGFVDFHTHLFRHGSQFGLDADLLASSGVTAAADMGSAGWVNFPAMYHCDLAGKKLRLSSYLNISPVGQPGRGINEPLTPEAVSEDGIRKILEEYPGQVTGLKVRLTRGIVGDLGTAPLKRAVEMGERFGLPVCVHTTDPPETPDRIAAMLRPGDIYSHIYQGKGHHSAETETVLNGMLKAKERGVLFEVGNGRVNFNYVVAEKCLEAGLYPDIISSDATPATFHKGPAMWDLPRVVTKFVHMGMPFADAIRAVTETPARVLGMDNTIGKIAPGFEADLAIFQWNDETIDFCDSDGSERTGSRGLVPVMTIRHGQVIWENKGQEE